ncbi:uncharacterized protein I303_104653 [Kwoniella dejecticola CBS 10117]|uniref:Uncharacterized protein n=1 Tax=Kwoniella dejecticola CBS 10117 TaxID=1296121 RepID=A0A1A6A4Q1_9TREE|nr:uncharacterized protein I303_04367 [Kwoniella dejecticola CBS 10117]OBR85039.1 hypothetical protein I303_04367 [Kwoniella dejecticola CBS 10117]
MSLGVSPSSSSPLTTHSRPLPPSRKRNSYTPSPKATPRLTPEPSFAQQDDESAHASPSIRQQDGTMGGLRERSEEELVRANRDELEDALRNEWEEREGLLQRLEQAELERKELLTQQAELSKGMSALQTRSEEAFNEQSRMEADLEERDELLDRLRKRLADAERQARDSQKRYVEQEQTFEIERQALQAQESHLQQKLKTLSSASSSRRSVTPTPPETENVASLRDELASLNLSHSTLLAKLNTITKELHEMKIVNQELVEENEGWEFLMRERTLNGKLRQQGGLLSDQPEDEISISEPPQSAGSDRDLEEEMSELASDLENQSPIFDDDHQFFTDLDGHEENTKRKDDFLAPPRARRGKKNRPASPGGEASASGLDLASELDMADDKSVTGRSIVSGRGKNDETSALKAELKQLKESNKALTLYCSKIIDRIIAQEGFEHVLSVDYKTRRGTARATSTSASTSSRPALKDILDGPRSMTTSPISEEPPTVIEPEAEPVKPKKARPLSLMVRAMTGPAEKSVPPPAAPAPASTAAEDSKAERRAKRGFSLDFRSLGFGNSSSTPADSSKSSLRPLTLSSKSTSTSGRSTSNSNSNSNSARKLDIHDEDEEDRRERHRMEATLKLMGINRTPSPSIQEEPDENGSNRNNLLSKGNWISSGRTSTSSRRSSETPLERLSSTIGTKEDLTIPFEDVHDPQQAIQALRAFDEREAQKRKEIQKGKRNSAYTSPPKIGHGRRISVESKEDQDMRNRTISKSESINTLWSMGGGDSRPTSEDFSVQRK